MLASPTQVAVPLPIRQTLDLELFQGQPYKMETSVRGDAAKVIFPGRLDIILNSTEFNHATWTDICMKIQSCFKKKMCVCTEMSAVCDLFTSENKHGCESIFCSLPLPETSTDEKVIPTVMADQRARPVGSRRHLTRPRADCQSGRSEVLPSRRLLPSEGKCLLCGEDLRGREAVLGGRQLLWPGRPRE